LTHAELPAIYSVGKKTAERMQEATPVKPTTKVSSDACSQRGEITIRRCGS